MMKLITELINKYRHFSYRLHSVEKKFTDIYAQGGFSGNEFPESGVGASLQQTAQIRRELEKLFDKYNVKFLLDAPCGDFSWMCHVTLDNIEYIGLDIVENVINQNIAKHANNIRTFKKINIIQEPLPQSDMILCRDCFIHLSNKDVILTLRNFKKSGAKYLLTTTFPGVTENTNMVSGRGCRPINLLLPPFNLPMPIENIIEGCTEEDSKRADKSLGLWNLIDLKLDY